MKLTFKLSAILLLTAAFTACKDGEAGDMITLSSANTITFKSGETTKHISFVADKDWEISVPTLAWISVTPTSGASGSTYVTVTMKESNDTGSERWALVRIMAGGDTASVKVIQEAEEPKAPDVEILPQRVKSIKLLYKDLCEIPSVADYMNVYNFEYDDEGIIDLVTVQYDNGNTVVSYRFVATDTSVKIYDADGSELLSTVLMSEGRVTKAEQIEVSSGSSIRTTYEYTYAANGQLSAIKHERYKDIEQELSTTYNVVWQDNSITSVAGGGLTYSWTPSAQENNINLDMGAAFTMIANYDFSNMFAYMGIYGKRNYYLPETSDFDTDEEIDGIYTGETNYAYTCDDDGYLTKIVATQPGHSEVTQEFLYENE